MTLVVSGRAFLLFLLSLAFSFSLLLAFLAFVAFAFSFLFSFLSSTFSFFRRPTLLQGLCKSHLRGSPLLLLLLRELLPLFRPFWSSHQGRPWPWFLFLSALLPVGAGGILLVHFYLCVRTGWKTTGMISLWRWALRSCLQPCWWFWRWILWRGHRSLRARRSWSTCCSCCLLTRFGLQDTLGWRHLRSTAACASQAAYFLARPASLDSFLQPRLLEGCPSSKSHLLRAGQCGMFRPYELLVPCHWPSLPKTALQRLEPLH